MHNALVTDKKNQKIWFLNMIFLSVQKFQIIDLWKNVSEKKHNFDNKKSSSKSACPIAEVTETSFSGINSTI